MGAPAARSVLLTLLGEYVLPAAGNVWQETLIGALETLGYKTPAARRALARSVTAGWLRAERHGRRSRVHLTPATAEMLRSGTERIYSFGDPWTWDGRWLLVVLRVPEERREVRHQVRTRLAWAGFGSLGGGLWISPARRARTRAARRDAGGVGRRARLLPRRDRRRRRPGEGRRRGVGPRRGLRGLPRLHRALRPPAPELAAGRLPRPDASSSTSGAGSPSSIPTCRPTCCRPAGRASVPTTCSASATRNGTAPPRSTSGRSRCEHRGVLGPKPVLKAQSRVATRARVGLSHPRRRSPNIPIMPVPEPTVLRAKLRRAR